MKRILFALMALPAPTSYAQQPVPEIPFDSVPNFLKLPADMNFGEVSGVAVNSKGEVAVFTRSNSAGGPAYGATASQVLLFDKTGKFLREVGKGLYAWSYAHADPLRQGRQPLGHRQGLGHDRPHQPRRPRDDGVRPEEGSVGRGRAVGSASRRRGRRCNGQFRQPTDVAWDTDGNIYISDGYINSRVAKFTKDGDWVASLGEPGGGKLGRAEHAAHASPTTPRATSTSATAATAASR